MFLDHLATLIEISPQCPGNYEPIESSGKIESNAFIGRRAARQPWNEFITIDTELRTELCVAATDAMQQCT